MKIAYIISSIDNSTGGPARSVTNLITAILNDSSHKIELYCGESKNPIITNFEDLGGSVHFCKHNRLVGLKGFRKNLNISNHDLLHGHGLWQMPVHQMAVSARKLGVPYIISPRGMLDKWSINHKGFKKKIALSLYQNKDLDLAAGFHATSLVEAKNIRETGYKNPIAVIPNGVIVPDFVKREPDADGKRKILFLSRLVKNKGIEELLLAWSKLDPFLSEKWELNVVGAGDDEYEKRLNEKKLELNLSNVKFRGAAYGKDKDNYFEEADLFVLPTYTENFGVAIAEALAYQIPVITTKGAPWSDLVDYKCGWWIDKGVEPLIICLSEALDNSPVRLKEMGENGRKLIQNKYSLTSVSTKMIEYYDWIINKGEKPTFILTDL